MKKGEVDNLTEHLNTIDPTGNIKFTYETEEEGRIPFLDTLIIRKPDGSTKLCIYRKKTHTDQYLQFTSHHPLHQKLGVIRTLLDRKDSLVTEDEDKREEEKKLEIALTNCGYPKWSIAKVETARENKKEKPTNKKKADSRYK